MSSMDLPRIFFHGQAQANVPTGNNEGPPALVDIATCSLNPLPFKDDLSTHNWLMQLSQDGKSVNGGWNYFGDNSFVLDQVEITGVQYLDGTVTHDQDPLIGKKVDFPRAFIIDLDPWSDFSSYVIANHFKIGDPDKDHEAPWLRAQELSQGTMRWVNTTRNFYSMGEGREGAFIQFVIPKHLDEHHPQDMSFHLGINGSEALRALEQAVDAADGLVITCVFYNFDLHDDAKSATKTFENFNKGDFHSTPAIGFVVGSIGVWHAYEPKQIPSGRYLGPVGTLEPPASVEDKGPFSLGPALLQVGARPEHVTLNLMNTFPELDQATQTKVDIGHVYLAWRPSPSEPLNVLSWDPIPYDKAAYLKTAGIVDVQYDTSQYPDLSQGQFILLRQAPAVAQTADQELHEVILHELDYIVITDDWAVYVNRGQSTHIDLQVLSRGRPAPAGVEVSIYQYRLIDPAGARLISNIDPTLLSAVESADHEPDPDRKTWEMKVWTDGDGRIHVPLRGVNLGTTILRYMVNNVDRPAWNWDQGEMDFYSHIRVMPDEDLSQVPTTWENVYREVLRYY